MTYVPQYDRHYCYRCRTYAPPGFGEAQEVRPCPTCGQPLTYIAQYDRWYCYACRAYAPKERAEIEVIPVPFARAAAEEAVEQPPAEGGEGEEAAPTVEGEPLPAEEEEERPPLTRERIEGAKKADLVSLAKAYGLPTRGTKGELQNRLIERMVAETEVEGAPSEAPAEGLPPEVEEVEAALAMEAEEARGEEAAAPSEEAEAPKEAAAEHPCPTCGREMRHVVQYDRWWCDDCRRYAPKPEARPCPTCGGELTYVPQYDRHYCYACQTYAPLDAAAVSPAATVPPAVEARPAAETAEAAASPRLAAVTHRHGNPKVGIGLVGTGLLLYVLYAVLFLFPAVGGPAVGVPNEVGVTLQVLAFVFLFLGVLAALLLLRGR
jgi:ssDNA-binding Zn-finger/Zn-ribbon topoisomerase 1